MINTVTCVYHGHKMKSQEEYERHCEEEHNGNLIAVELSLEEEGKDE